MPIYEVNVSQDAWTMCDIEVPEDVWKKGFDAVTKFCLEAFEEEKQAYDMFEYEPAKLDITPEEFKGATP